MSEIVYVSGEYLQREDAKISVFDHGLLYGDGVFEGIRFYERNLFRLREHLERLRSSARYINLGLPHTLDELAELIKETCRKNDFDNGYIRLIITRGVGSLGLDPYKCVDPGVIIIVSKIKMYPEEYYENGLPMIVAATRRFDSTAISPRVKSLNYLNNIMAKMEAIHSGTLEALMLDQHGFIVECTGDNFFIVKKNVVYTPPTYQGALRGVTRDAVIELAKEEGYEVREERLTLYEAFDADECFLTGTAAEVIPVISIDARVIGSGNPGPVTGKLIEKFRSITNIDGEKF